MYSVQEQLKNYLYDHKEAVLNITGRLSLLNSLAVIVLLLWRYGFYLSPAEATTVSSYLDFTFGTFALVFLIRWGFSYRWLAYLKESYFEALLIFLIILNGLVHYLFDYNALLDAFDHIESVIAFLGIENSQTALQHALSGYAFLLVGLEFIKASARLTEVNLKPSTTFLMSFILLILGGAGLLMLPAMTVPEEEINLLDALFTSVSASCVTGLSVKSTADVFTVKGQLVIMFLIQLGGIGIVSFATFFATFLAKGVGLKHQSIIQDHLSSENLVSATDLLRKVVFLTIIIEVLGAIAIFLTWEDDLPGKQFESLGQKVFYCVFHSISAFCNGGFSLFAGGLNDVSYEVRQMYGLHFVVAIIIVLGSLGFSTMEDIFSLKTLRNLFNKPWRHWELGTRVAVSASLWLILVGTVGFMVLEYGNLSERTILESFITSLFQSITTRTAGFNTVDMDVGVEGGLHPATVIMFLFLMFIGAVPGSTGGGIKVTTFLLIVLSSVANIKRQERVEIYKRTINEESIYKAFSIFMFAVAYNGLAIFLLALTEPDQNILKLTFEQVSAFATVGLSLDLTPELSDLGKCIIIVSMYLGRVGTLTLALALSDSVVTNSYRYPESHLMVG